MVTHWPGPEKLPLLSIPAYWKFEDRTWHSTRVIISLLVVSVMLVATENVSLWFIWSFHQCLSWFLALVNHFWGPALKTSQICKSYLLLTLNVNYVWPEFHNLFRCLGWVSKDSMKYEISTSPPSCTVHCSCCAKLWQNSDNDSSREAVKLSSGVTNLIFASSFLRETQFKYTWLPPSSFLNF